MVFQHFCVSLCFLLLTIDTVINGNLQFKFNDMKSCKSHEFYDLVQFKCSPCPNDMQTNDDGFSCVCKKPKTRQLVLYDGSEQGPTCGEKCQGECIECTLKYINVTNMADVEKHVKVTRYNTYFNESDCRLMTAEVEQACHKQWNTLYEDLCTYTELLQPYVKYSYFWQSSATNFINGQLKYVAFLCLELQNITACQHLANLCVLSHFSSDKNSPCHAFNLAQSNGPNQQFADHDATTLHKLRPLLFLPRGKETAQLLKNPFNVSVLSYANNQPMLFFSTTHRLEGQLRRWGSFHMNHIDLCCLQSAACSANSNDIRFAKVVPTRSCTLTLENLIDYAQSQANDYFLSIFLNFTASVPHNKQIMLQTIPLLIGESIDANKRQTEMDWQLVTRFLPIEAHPRRQIPNQPPSYEDAHKLAIYQSIRFVEHIELHYTIFEENHISLPFMKLYYRQIDLRPNSTLQDRFNFSYSVHFTHTNVTDISSYILQDILLPLFLLVAVVLAALHTYNFKQRHVSELSLNCDALFEFLLELLSQISHAILLYVCLQTSYVVILLHPTNELNNSIYTFIHLALLLKFIFCCIYFWRQTGHNLYFIDWERPKVHNNNIFNLKCNLDSSSVCSSARALPVENNVSSWRMILLANYWLNLCSQKRTSLAIRAIVMHTVYHFTDLGSGSDNNRLLSLYSLGIMYAVIYGIQKLWCLLIKDQFSLNPLEEFSRLCSLCNISVLALVDRFSYGYYVHGRSPHGFADTDVHSLVSQLQRQPKMNRGLLSDSDQQHYLVLPPLNLRNYLARLVLTMENATQSELHREINTVDGQLERNLSAQNNLNRFFCAFIDHAIKDMDYIIKEKNLWEDLFHCEYDNYLTENKGTFYINNSMEFGRLFLYGNDWHIFVVTLLLMLSIGIQTENNTFSIIFVMLFDRVLELIYAYLSRENLVRKTSIDKRLLF